MTTSEAKAIATVLGAASFAASRHRGQRRKDEQATPYINHPIDVARILAESGIGDIDILCAALLHDTVEDTSTTAEEIGHVFGQRVCQLVFEVSDDKSLPKQERKRLQIVNAPRKSGGAKLVKIADKISNLRDLVASPPRDWSLERKAEYAEFARRVVSGCRGIHPPLEAAFDEALAAAHKAFNKEYHRRHG